MKQHKAKMSKEAADEAASNSIPVIQKIENYLNQNFKLRYNEVTGRVEFLEINKSEQFEELNDYTINSINRKMLKDKISCSTTLIHTVLNSDYTPVYNPFKTYLNNLPAWDGETDYIDELANTITTTNNSLWSFCFRKWLVAMVGSLLDDNVINHTVIVFSGAQGIGKTTWMLNLVPAELKKYCFSGTINPNNKDTLIQLSECMLINLDELENLNRSELGAMKEIITKNGIRVRRPYGYSADFMPRRASFAGSVNGKEFLNDTTGSRRFLCFEVTAINYMHSIALQNVLSQAVALFKSGFQYWFDTQEIKRINKNNEQFRIMSVEEELLLAYFNPCSTEEADYFFTTTELIHYFTQRVKITLTEGAKQKMGKALRAHKFERLKKQGRYVYALQEKQEVVNNELSSVAVVGNQMIANG